ncbi:tetraacyldisaccharide 4'-kinase [Gangjinia marincola]|uniref:Tetraacyldisaccharide 4'-kinase n=1 Tax=Gangjinia marincola TaxID=578463 RepID=A0ABP3XZ81_9FLAO
MILTLRNLCYNKGWFTSTNFDLPIICVGNLSVGGTGKSPMIEYLVRLLQKDYQLAILSRGYKRKTSGFYELTGNETAKMVGDEPLQFKSKFDDIIVAVDEQRVRGVQTLLNLSHSPQVILLDDAFQHRKISPSFTILLTKHNELYVDDFVLPTGNLREPRSGVTRADIVVITKCPNNISNHDMRRVKDRLTGIAHDRIFFSAIQYDQSVFSSKGQTDLVKFVKTPFTLVTGIADPSSLINKLRTYLNDFEVLSFPDHHNFTARELAMLSSYSRILTTEKDFTRLNGYLAQGVELYYLPITSIILDDERTFNELITNHINEKRRI